MRLRPKSPGRTVPCSPTTSARDPELLKKIGEYGLVRLGSAPIASKREKGNRRIAIYTRFSTENQTEKSTERQLSDCYAYATSLSEGTIDAYSDEAKTGTNMERPKLQLLLSRIHEYQIVIVENFDRWSREVYEAIPMAQFLESHGIEFHCSKVRRRLTKEDIVYAAMRSESDSKRRTELLVAGLDQLVESGGIPWGSCYGFKLTETPGFPEIDTQTSHIVEEIFQRIAGGASINEVTRSLNRRGIPSPGGKKNWPSTTVTKILRNPIYTGLIQYRRTTIIESRGKNKIVRSDRLQENHNERYRIVSDELYIAANEKKPHTKTVNDNRAITKHSDQIIQSIHCDCPNVSDQKMTFGREGKLICAERLHRGNCPKKIPAIPNLGAIVLRATYEQVFGDTEPETYASTCRARLAELVAHHQQNRAKLITQKEEMNALANRAFFDGLVKGWSGPRIEENRSKLEAEVQDLDARIAAIPDIKQTAMDEVELVSFQEMLRSLESRQPFKPVDQSDYLFIEALHRLVPDVQICREGHLEGSVTIRISIACDAMLVRDDHAQFAADAIVDTPYILCEETMWTPARHERMEELARSGRYALTNEQWRLVEARVANPPNFRGKIPVRIVADACIFRMRTGIAFGRSPAHFGNPSALKAAMFMFTYSRRLDAMIAILGAYDPNWLEGLAIELFAAAPRVSLTAIRPYVFAHHRGQEADLLASGTGRLTDDQWQAVLPVIPPMAVQHADRVFDVSDTRNAFDAILIKLRSGCGWNKLPSVLGDPARMYLDLQRVIYSGSWDTAVEIWARDHPEVLQGLDLSQLRRFKRSTQVEKQSYPDDVWRPVRWTEAVARHMFKPLTDNEWTLIGSVIQNAASRLALRRRGKWDRVTIDAILYKLSTQTPWETLPIQMGNGNKTARWFRRLVELGIWQEIVRELRNVLPTTLDRFGYRG